MRRVFVDHDEGRENPFGAAVYFAALTPEDVERWGADTARLPGLPRSVSVELLRDYRSYVGALDSINRNHPAYWRTPLGIRDTEKSLLLIGLDHLWRLDHLLSQDGGADIVLLTSDPGFAQAAAAVARTRGCDVTLQTPSRWQQAVRQLRGFASAGRYLLSLSGGGGCVRRPDRPRDAEIIIVTATALAHLERPEGPRDFIFGSLPEDLLAQGLSVVMLAQLVGETGSVSAAGRASHAYPARMMSDLTGPVDACISLLRAATARVECRGARSALGIDVTPLVHSDIARARWRDLPGYMLLETALGRLIETSPRAVLLHSFENNAWESVCHDLAARHRLTTIGLQHNALLRSSLKLYQNPARPQPDLVVTTGEEYRRLLIEEFGYEPDRVIAGFATRQPALQGGMLKQAPPSAVSKILVLLQGPHASAQLLGLLRDAFAGGAQVTITLRPHPAIPLAVILKNAALQLAPPFRESEAVSLVADLAAHDVVVTCTSTAAMEAVAQGVPAITVDIGEMAEGSPLFACPALNVMVDSAAALRLACEHFVHMPADEFHHQAAQARRFFDSAFAPRTADKVADIVSQIRRRGRPADNA